MSEIFETLRYVSIFEGLTAQDLENISSFCKTVTYPAGDMILMSEDQGKTFYIIDQGKVKISLISGNSHEITMSLLGRCDFFGEMSILDENPRAADVIALSDVKLLMIYKDDFLALLMKYPIISISLLKEICYRLRKTNIRIKNKNSSSLEKTIQALLDIADCQGKMTQEGILLPELTHLELAYFAELSRETFTRSLSTLKKKNLVTNYSQSQRQLIIQDINKLKALLATSQRLLK